MFRRTLACVIAAGTLFTAVPAEASYLGVPRPPVKVRKAIRHFWGPDFRERQAIRVAYCESTYRTTAANGQYRGIFQMGSYERATFGHGSTAWAQAKAAHRYFVVSGKDWSPWACKP